MKYRDDLMWIFHSFSSKKFEELYLANTIPGVPTLPEVLQDGVKHIQWILTSKTDAATKYRFGYNPKELAWLGDFLRVATAYLPKIHWERCLPNNATDFVCTDEALQKIHDAAEECIRNFRFDLQDWDGRLEPSHVRKIVFRRLSCLASKKYQHRHNAHGESQNSSLLRGVLREALGAFPFVFDRPLHRVAFNEIELKWLQEAMNDLTKSSKKIDWKKDTTGNLTDAIQKDPAWLHCQHVAMRCLRNFRFDLNAWEKKELQPT